VPLGGALTVALIGAAATKYSSDQQAGAKAREAGIANTGKAGSFNFTPTASKTMGLGDALKNAGGQERSFNLGNTTELTPSQVNSGAGAPPAQGLRLKEALERDAAPGPQAVEGLDDGPAKFAQMNNPAMQAGPKPAGGSSWLNADTVGTAAQVAGALAGSGGGPPSAGIPQLGSTNYNPTAIRLQEALGRMGGGGQRFGRF
jgi:hypothetical protein